MADLRKLGGRSFRNGALRALATLALGCGGVVACGSADDGGLTGAAAGGAGGAATCAGLSCYDACLCEGGEPTPCLDQCANAGGSGQGGSGAGGSGAGGSGAGGSGAQGGSGAGGSGAGGSGAGGSGAQGGSGAGGSGAGGSGNSCDPGQCPSAQGYVKGCCAASDRCGLDLSGFVQGGGCVESNQPGTRDDSCPATNIYGQQIPGCCRADNTCGYLDSFLGLGCVSPTDFGAPPGGRC